MGGRTSNRTFWMLAIVLALIVVVLLWRMLNQQPSSSTGIPVTGSSPMVTQQPLPSPEADIDVLRERIESTSKRVDDISNLLNNSFTFFAIILALASGVSLYGFFRAEGRAGETHALFVKGERGVQHRANSIYEEFLGSSKTTIELVNATLQLAKEESERAKEARENAARSVAENTRSALELLDRRAQLLITKVPEENVHDLVSNPILRADLRKLAGRIESFETNRIIYPTLLPLTPSVILIRGINAHLEQHFEESIESWEEVVVHKEAAGNLKRLAWYWIGRERNNLGDFNEAQQSFSNARMDAPVLMDLELQRNILESKFFDREQATDLINPLEDLLNYVRKIEGESFAARHIRERVLTTLGSVTLEAGDECEDDEGTRKYYQKALTCFNEVGNQNKWALFGKAEALYSLGKSEESYPIYRAQLRPLATREIESRIEPRTRTTARTMYLICCIRVPDLWDEVPTARDNVLRELDEVDDRLTIYSEIKHRNVGIKDFRMELDQLIHDWEQKAGRA
jgi:tetratricopeptide (TPR) repeat protein